MSKAERYEHLLASVYQTVSAIVHQNEHPTSDGDAHDAALLDILSSPDSLSLEAAQKRLGEIAQYYWDKEAPNVSPKDETP